MRFERIWSWPKPAQHPHPPVMIGGNGPKVIDRVLRYGDAWMPQHRHGNAIQRIDELQRRAAEAGRGHIPVVVFGVPAKAEVLAEYEQAGADRAVHWLPAAQRGPVEQALERFEARDRGAARPVSADEYILDTPVVREFVAGVRETIAAAGSPAEACDAIRPRFASLLADPAWLPERYQEGDPESGMGGGIGQWLLFRAGDRSLTLFALVVPSGSQTPIHDHLAWGLVGLYRGTQDEEIYAHADGGDLERVEARALAPGDFYALLPPRDDIHRVRTTSERDLGVAAPAHERHRLRVAPRVRRAQRRGEPVPLGLRQRGLRGVIHSALARARTSPSGESSADAVWCLRPSDATCQPVAITGSPTSTQSSRSTASRASTPGAPSPQRGGARAVQRRPHHAGRDDAVAVRDGRVGQEHGRGHDSRASRARAWASVGRTGGSTSTPSTGRALMTSVSPSWTSISPPGRKSTRERHAERRRGAQRDLGRAVDELADRAAGVAAVRRCRAGR